VDAANAESMAVGVLSRTQAITLTLSASGTKPTWLA